MSDGGLVAGYGGGAAPDDPDDVATETVRHGHLGANFDAGSARLLSRVGLTTGWHVLEVGAGGGSMARWLSDQVGPDGRVMATDIDLQFVGEQPANVILRQHDIVADRLPAEHFDLAHARAVLQHVPEREQALANMVAATKPGGWVVIEDVDWLVFDSQELPEPFATLSSTVRGRRPPRPTATTGTGGGGCSARCEGPGWSMWSRRARSSPCTAAPRARSGTSSPSSGPDPA